MIDPPDGPVGAAEQWPAAVSIGTNPTFDGASRRVEAYVLGRTDLDLYGAQVVIEYVARIRPTLRFGSVDELVAHMHRDIADVESVLAECC